MDTILFLYLGWMVIVYLVLVNIGLYLYRRYLMVKLLENARKRKEEFSEAE